MKIRLILLLLSIAVSAAAQQREVVTPEIPSDIAPKTQTLQPGVKLTMLAEHPDLATPTGIDVDIEGNIWVVSCHTHFRPNAYQGPEKDEVLIFDADGKNRRLFYNATEATMDLELGPGGWVYLAERDRILRVRDSDGDGVGDVEEDIAVLDTTADYPHNGLTGLARHPGGYLMFALGENYWKDWTLTGVDGSAVSGTGEGGIFRCAMDGKLLERIAVGFWNPFGVLVREDLEMFVAENDPGARPPCRLIHLVEGGDYGYQRHYGNAPFHPFVAWNGELRGTLPMLDASGEAPCGIAQLGGGVIVPSWSHNRIDFFSLKRNGASYDSTRIEMLRGSDNFRPTCIAEGPDGAFYFTDWVFTSYELHTLGRLWKLEIDRSADWIEPKSIEPQNDAAALAQELRSGKSKLQVPQLLKHARSDDSFLARAALQALSTKLKSYPADWDAEDRANAVYARSLAEPKDETWVRAALADENADVRFEAVRWIADKNLTQFADEIDTLFTDPNLDYRMFEACLAAANTLSGEPRKGITDIPMLLERVNDEEASSATRAYALRLLPPNHPRVTQELLLKLVAFDDGQAAESGDEELVLEVVRCLAGKADEASLDILAQFATQEKNPLAARLEAILGLGASPEAHSETLVALRGDSNPQIVAEADRALRGTESGGGLTAKTIMMDNPPGMTDTAGWRKRIDAAEGEPDVEAGRRIFFHSRLTRCATCHRHSGRGAVVGPDLSAVGIGPGEDIDWLLTQIIDPGREVAPQFHPWQLDLKDGSTFVGFALRKGGRSGKEFYRDITGAEKAILKTDIIAREEVKTSLMPPGLTMNLTAEELSDLIAFLQASGR
ncbi:MAG: PVC-type heme-binding CxxCH protein [Verrucomicrobiota bacterium]